MRAVASRVPVALPNVPDAYAGQNHGYKDKYRDANLDAVRGWTMAFGLGLPPHKYVLDKLGTRLRDYYDELLDLPEPEHLRSLIGQLLARH